MCGPMHGKISTRGVTATLGYQMATFCYTGVAVQSKRLAVKSISNRTGCCLCRLPHQCSDWARQICHHAEVDSKSTCTNKRCGRDVRLSNGNFLLHWRRSAKTVGNDLDQQQNWLLSVPSSPSMLGLGRQICHHAEVD